MNDELIDDKDFGDAEKHAIGVMLRASADLLSDVHLDEVDSVALIINDHESPDEFSTELWVNDSDVVDQAVKSGVRLSEARWLYEHWLPEAAKGEVLSSEANPTTDRTRYYSLVVETVNQIRTRFSDLKGTLFLVDNNHDYDSLVVASVAAANPDGQASEWLKSPPPDC